MKALPGVVLVVVLSFFAVGCSSADTVTENDRVMEGHLVQMADLLGQLADAVDPLDPALAKALRGIVADMKLETSQLVANHGPAKVQTPYTTANARAAADESKKDHATPWWKAALWSAGGILLTVLGLKVGTDAVPALASRFAGPWGAVASVGLNVLGDLIRKSQGGTTPPSGQTVEDTVMAHADDADVKDLVARLLAKAKLGIPSAPPGSSVPTA
jgi:hypothetical protein